MVPNSAAHSYGRRGRPRHESELIVRRSAEPAFAHTLLRFRRSVNSPAEQGCVDTYEQRLPMKARQHGNDEEIQVEHQNNHGQ